MQKGTMRAVSALVMAFALGACQDTPAAIHTPPSAADAQPTLLRGAEGYVVAGEKRTGWIVGRNGQPKRISYEVQGELAIWQGDIIIGQARHIATSESQLRAQLSGDARAAVYIDGNGYRWPGGVVPFVIAGTLTNTARVTDAIAMVEQATAGVQLVPRTDEDNYIVFQPADGCSSAIGMVGGAQAINLGDNCGTGNAAHEILHALALYHEHTRCDRDGFVTVEWDNIQEDKKHNFDRQCDDATDHDVYDEGSIMHYGTNFFAIDDTKPTLISLRGRDADMGQRNALGATDIATINLLYGANNAAPTADLDVSAAPYTEGNVISFDASGSSDPDDAELTYLWDFGDGSCAVVPQPAKCTAEAPNHGYTDEGTYTVTLTVSDGDKTDDASTQIAVANVAPIVNAGPDASTTEGALFTRNGSFSDTGTDSWSATVDYGDGSGAQALTLTGKGFTLSHTYIDNGSYTVTVTVDDNDGGIGNDPVTMTITNVVPVVDAGANATVESGSNFQLTGGFTDAGIIDNPWAWTVAWGFTASSTGTTNVQGANVFNATVRACAAGDYQVNVSVKDKDHGTGSDVMTLSVSYYPVSIDITPTRQPNPINMGKGGLVAVAILSTPTFNAAAADPSKITLGNELGVDTPVAQQNKGAYHAKIEDVNRDGRLDLVVMFEAAKLVANGDIALGTTQLVLRGFLNDNCVNFRAVDQVIILP